MMEMPIIPRDPIVSSILPDVIPGINIIVYMID